MDSMEMRELLHQILTNQQDQQRITDMQRAGDSHVAERIMEAGQIVRALGSEYVLD